MLSSKADEVIRSHMVREKGWSDSLVLGLLSSTVC